ncbi:hypothetical protein GCM10007859_13580 [Brevundimonas denitrificans]|uniref:FecR protein domain-containing protein n=1 Tax=Brevundimonas denitrificans TaxID=1443434 RepID=A0ABQ6BH33_9CAUL|nr:FecR family protein [Brevundimonas denitrificans]GLS01345.1 hypothetical protein GCM10007859_13580 [Brevundimonas denitrificans]
MKRCFLIVAGLLAVLAGPVAAQTPVGVNAVVENSVRTRSADESAWRPSVVDGTVRQADAIVTGADSRLMIRLRDQSMLTVGANAALNVDRFVIDTEAEPAGVLVSLVRGAFRFVSGSRGAEQERTAFRTPTATIGIRGTIIEAAVGTEALELLDGETGTPGPADDPEQAAVIVLVEGEIEIEVDGVRRIVREPGQAVAVRGRRVSEPFRLSPEAGQRLAGRLPPREPGGPGAGPQGQPPLGQPPQGQGPQGSGPQGQGQAPQGQTPQGVAVKGQTPQAQAPGGRANRGQENRGAQSRPGSSGPGQQPGAGPGGAQRPG